MNDGFRPRVEDRIDAIMQKADLVAFLSSL